MGDDYTPTTDAVRDFYVDHRVPTCPWTRFGDDEIAAVESAQSEFDRWYAAERAKWQAEALVDAAEAFAYPEAVSQWTTWGDVSDWLAKRAGVITPEARP